MTLFEAVVDPEDLAVRRSAHLPLPTKTRYVPLRAGVINVWEYDEQQFWFADGRLLLRGRNEAGKSKVLELLFPFVLDGDTSPKKLDPFDTANKSMWWNMIGFHKDRVSAIGYLWIEFGRLDETGAAQYLTSIVGVQATRSERKVATWFALTPQRIDVDLNLAPGQVCRTQDSFTTALSPEARFATKAVAHRANVASWLFAMSPERFDNLLHLLRQLRKPKLADKLDAKKLSAVLTDALPPVDETRIKPLADGFGFLDADIEDLRRTEVAHRATTSFLDVYRGYAQAQVRHRADVVRGAVTRFDGVTRDAAEAERKLQAACSETKRLTDETLQLARDHAEAAGNLSGLDLSAVESLRSLQQLAGADAKLVDSTGGEALRADDAARLASDDAAIKGTATAEDLDALTGALADARGAADRAGVDPGWEQVDHAHSADQLTGAVGTRRALVEAVADAERRVGKAREKLDAAAARLAVAAESQQEASDALAVATEAVAEAQSRFVDAVDAWRDLAPSQLPSVAGSDIAEELIDRLAAGDRSGRAVALRVAAPARDAATAAQELATGSATNAARNLDEARQALEALDALPADPPPPRRPGIPDGRSGVPLWLAVEFTDTVDPGEAAMLEAALDAAGLLDAAITAEGLVALDSDDTLLVAQDPDAAGLRDWLHPAEGTDAALVARAIAAIGAGPDAGTACWVDLDGSWANGPLTGRWSKPVADHIGAAARTAARLRRRGELTVELTAADEAAQAATAALLAAKNHAALVDAWTEDFPSLADWSGAAHDLRTATAKTDKAGAAHAKADKAHTEEHDKVAEQLRAVELAVEASGCQPDDVPALRGALDAATERAHKLGSAARDHSRSSMAASAARVEADRLGLLAAESGARLEEARLAATTSKAKYDTAVALEGADVERILAEKERLETSLQALQHRQHQVGLDKSAARETEIRAESVLAETERRRDEVSAERDDALVALAAVARTGHVTLTLGVDAGRDPADYLQPTAGRNLARQIASAVDEDQGTEEARSRATDRLVTEFSRLRDDVGADFDPHLDTVEQLFVASATLNGEVIGVAQLHRALGDDVEQRKAIIAAEERTLIERHLRDEVGNHLGACLHAATTQVHQMNTILRAHPTNSGALVQLRWQVEGDAGPGVSNAIGALLTATATRDEAASATLAAFLGERVSLARSGDVEGADLAERLAAALDYRRWHSFKLSYKTGGGEGDLTARTVGAGSGGQQAKVGHLPLLAAAAGFYSSSPSAPRLCFLDEAFAGIDGPNTADLLKVSVTLDLDMVMTNYDAWFCVPQLPGLAIYHLEKLPGAVGVAAIRYAWDGHEQQEQDPWLDG